ncbi:MAG TPA: hypothetical protein VF600_06820 [Abditibacteriaceae bacterium]|jgi:hypothetical protein
MNFETSLLLFLRLMPAIIVFALAFIAASDAKTREQWVNLLYSAGILRPEQRSDPRVQRGVRLPFFIVAAALLIWPFRYYRHVTRTINATTGVFSRPSMVPTLPSARNSTATPTFATPVAPVAPPVPGVPQPETRPNMFGTPVPLTTPPAAPSPAAAVPMAPTPVAPPPPSPPSAP